MRAFNSATASPPWKHREAGPGGDVQDAFNSATASPPWKRVLLLCGVANSITSIRPRLHRRGNAEDRHGQERQDRTSIRPRLHRRGNFAEEHVGAELAGTSIRPRL